MMMMERMDGGNKGFLFFPWLERKMKECGRDWEFNFTPSAL